MVISILILIEIHLYIIHKAEFCRKEGVDLKIQALRAYSGVMRPYPHPRSEEYITGLAAYRGSQFQLDYAEAFEVVLRKY